MATPIGSYAEACKKLSRYHQRVSRGLCGQIGCKAAHVPGKSLCQPCLDNNARRKRMRLASPSSYIEQRRRQWAAYEREIAQ